MGAVSPVKHGAILIPHLDKKALQASLPPPAVIVAICSGLHESIFTLLTKETWVPKLLCIPLHSKHMKMPSFTEAHTGFFRSQSIHRSFPGSARRAAASFGSIQVMFDFYVRF
mmetsp:Transcript_9421/g.28118  ORF Transcript_9421/g.28118 Transcript_9421/m.28118 type:complete len:113 (+) Transcript_9421:793-1131(+)